VPLDKSEGAVKDKNILAGWPIFAPPPLSAASPFAVFEGEHHGRWHQATFLTLSRRLTSEFQIKLDNHPYNKNKKTKAAKRAVPPLITPRASRDRSGR